MTDDLDTSCWRRHLSIDKLFNLSIDELEALYDKAHYGCGCLGTLIKLIVDLEVQHNQQYGRFPEEEVKHYLVN